MELTRNIANEPAQYATPEKLAEIALSLGLETKFITEKNAKKWV
jgi:leucyl aminopeptidase